MVGAKAAHEARGRGHSLGVAALQDWRALGTYDALGTVTVWILVETTMVVFFFCWKSRTRKALRPKKEHISAAVTYVTA